MVIRDETCADDTSGRTHEAISNRFIITYDTLGIGVGWTGFLGSIGMHKPTLVPTFAIPCTRRIRQCFGVGCEGERDEERERTSSVELARLVLVVRGEFLVLPVQKLAVLPGEAPPGGFVELADASWFRSRWSFHVWPTPIEVVRIRLPSIGKPGIIILVGNPTLHSSYIINRKDTS